MKEEEQRMLGGKSSSEFHHHHDDDDDKEALFWKYPELRELELENTLIQLPPQLSSLSENNFAPKVLPLSMSPSKNTATTQVPPMFLAEDVAHVVQPNLQDQLPVQQNINSWNNTHDDHLQPQTQFLDSEVNQVALMLPAEVELPRSQINRSRPQNCTSSVSDRGKRWSKQEHRLFLEGLEKYGKGNWKSIANYAVKTRTSTQVASHAQKYFLHQQQASDRKGKRKSIHDMTLQDEDPVPHQQNWVFLPNLERQQQHETHHHLVPQHIHQPNLVLLPNPATQQHEMHHHLVPQHIHQPNWDLLPNPATQQHEMHHLVPHYINQQNWDLCPSPEVQQHEMHHHLVPHYINQQNWDLCPSPAVQQINQPQELLPLNPSVNMCHQTGGFGNNLFR